MSKGKDHGGRSSKDNKELGWLGSVVQSVCIATAHNPSLDPNVMPAEKGNNLENYCRGMGRSVENIFSTNNSKTSPNSTASTTNVNSSSDLVIYKSTERAINMGILGDNPSYNDIIEFQYNNDHSNIRNGDN